MRCCPLPSCHGKEVSRRWPRKASHRPAPDICERSNLSLYGFDGRVRLVFLALVPHPLVAHGASFQEALGFLIEALAVVAVEGRLPQNAVNGFGAEIVDVVEAVH